MFGPEHPSFRRSHLGLSFGVALFNQDAGHLGQLLTLMRQRDPARFDEIFGADASALCQITNAPGAPSAESANGRSARIQKIANADLWEEPWLTRFREAGALKAFQSIQNQLASALFLEPMLRFGAWMGMNTERALAILMDRAARLGVSPAQQWVANAAGVLQTAPQRHQAIGDARLRQHSRAPGRVARHRNERPVGTADTRRRDVGAAGAWRVTGADAHARIRCSTPWCRRSAQTAWSARLVALRNDVRLGDAPLHWTIGAAE